MWKQQLKKSKFKRIAKFPLQYRWNHDTIKNDDYFIYDFQPMNDNTDSQSESILLYSFLQYFLH